MKTIKLYRVARLSGHAVRGRVPERDAAKAEILRRARSLRDPVAARIVREEGWR